MEKKHKWGWERQDTFDSIPKSYIGPRLADIFSKTFMGNLFKGLSNYGGIPWAMIADAWGRLYTTSSLNDKMVLVDHIYDLQHNTDTVFNKVKEYYKDGYKWLKNALDFKKNIKDPFALYDKISPILQDPFAYVMKMQNGITLQGYKESIIELEVGMKVKLKKFKYGEKYGWGTDRLRVGDAAMRYSGKTVLVVQVIKNRSLFNIQEDFSTKYWNTEMVKKIISRNNKIDKVKPEFINVEPVKPTTPLKINGKKIQIGDKILFRKDLKLGFYYAADTFVKGMDDVLYRHKYILTVKGFIVGKGFRCEESGSWNWTPEMTEKILK